MKKDSNESKYKLYLLSILEVQIMNLEGILFCLRDFSFGASRRLDKP